MRDTRAQQIRAALVDPASVARHLLGITTSARTGTRAIKVCCPFHGDAKPSLSIFIGRDRTLGFECKAAVCGVSGDVLALLALRERLDTGRPEDFCKLLDVGMGLIGGASLPRIEHKEVHAPSPAALKRVLAKCSATAADVEVAACLRTRGINAATIDAGAVAFALPSGASALPRFAAPWPHTGHRLVLPGYDARGRIATLRARSVSGAEPKCRAPRGAATVGAVLANAAGLALLRGDAGAPDVVAVVEGEPDLLTLPPDVAGLGVVANDSWSADIARRVWGKRLTLAVHDDAAGDAYARTVLRSVSGRALVADLFARGRAARQAGVGGKGRWDLNELLLDGADLEAMLRDAEIVSDPDTAEFLAPEPAQDAPDTSDRREAHEAVLQRQRAALGYIATTARYLVLDDVPLKILRALVQFAWWHRWEGPDADLLGQRLGQCAPRMDTFAKAAGVSDRHLRRYLASIERPGRVIVDPMSGVEVRRRVTDDRGVDTTHLWSLPKDVIEAGMRCRT